MSKDMARTMDEAFNAIDQQENERLNARIEELEHEVAGLQIYKPAQPGTKSEVKAPIGKTNFKFYGMPECEGD